ncbi:MAG TPA: sn-glycerol-3-phosphate import ATP-binding protein UgpC [Alphaproteobacteria bacterium]|nr:sn-glycerol-3-phosphate import ATP-binding protein UgpC [Alphaproteobacteria bacterium]
MAEVSIRNVTKVYPNGFQAIHGVDVDIEDSEFLVLVGPSGCGKSTLLRMVAGLETITTGEVFIGRRMVNKLEPAERDIAMVFQNYALYPHMSVRQNMAYGLKVRGMPKKQIEEAVRRAAETLGLTELLDRKPRQLSGGQRQRVAMGRAIVREPQVFLFDEPLSNLDAKLRVQMRIEIKRLQERLGVTAVYVTHDQVEAMTLGHRLVVMNEGRAEQIGTPLELYECPHTAFVAGFIGSPAMNLLEGRLETKGVRLGREIHVALPETILNGALNAEVLFGVRPEHFEIVPPEQALLTIKSDLVEALGADTLVHGHSDGMSFTMRLPGSRHVSMGEDLPVYIAPENLHLFDLETGSRTG